MRARVRDCLAPEAPAVHPVDPFGIEALDPVDDVTHGLLVGEDADLLVVATHLAPEVLADDRRLVAGLDEQVGGKHAPRGLIDQHQRVPRGAVGGREEAGPGPAEPERIPVTVALDAAAIAPPR